MHWSTNVIAEGIFCAFFIQDVLCKGDIYAAMVFFPQITAFSRKEIQPFMNHICSPGKIHSARVIGRTDLYVHHRNAGKNDPGSVLIDYEARKQHSGTSQSRHDTGNKGVLSALFPCSCCIRFRQDPAHCCQKRLHIRITGRPVRIHPFHQDVLQPRIDPDLQGRRLLKVIYKHS